jgi:hypothetical protein
VVLIIFTDAVESMQNADSMTFELGSRTDA